MTAKLFTLPRQTVFTNAGALVPGAKAYFYINATTTAQAVYTDQTLTTAHPQPVVADGNGRFPAIYLDGGLLYKVVITDASDVEIYTEDNFQDVTGQFQNLRLEGGAPLITAKETSAGPDNGVFRWGANGEDWYLELVDDAETSVQRVMTVSRTGLTVDSIALVGTALTLNGQTVPNITNGTFSPNFTGFSLDPSPDTINWVKQGNIVYAHLLFATGTSNATEFTITNIPTAIRPDVAQTVSVNNLIDNTTSSGWGTITIGTGDVWTVRFQDEDDDSWTASGNKGFQLTGSGLGSSIISYVLDFDA